MNPNIKKITGHNSYMVNGYVVTKAHCGHRGWGIEQTKGMLSGRSSYKSATIPGTFRTLEMVAAHCMTLKHGKST